ncbi:hypothetical protein ACFL05_00805 [Patescibacteria group bacterium]
MKNNFATTIILLVVAISLLVVSFTREKEKEETIEETKQALEQIQKTLSPYESKNKMKKITIVNNFQNFVTNEKESNSFNKIIIVKGTIKNGLLYAHTSVNDQALSEYDDIYVKLARIIGDDYIDFGGHLIESQSLEIPSGKIIFSSIATSVSSAKCVFLRLVFKFCTLFDIILLYRYRTLCILYTLIKN